MVGVILMVAIVVVLAAVVAVFTMELGNIGSVSNAAVDVEAEDDGYAVTVLSMGSADVVRVRCDGEVRGNLSEAGSQTVVSGPCDDIVVTTGSDDGGTAIRNINTSELSGYSGDNGGSELQFGEGQWEPLHRGDGTYENEYRDDHVWQWVETSGGITGTSVSAWWVTTEKHNLSNVNEIEVEWESPSGKENNRGGVGLEIVEQQDSVPPVEHNTGRQFNFNRTTGSLNVSGYNSEYYIRITTYARDSYDGEGSLKVYSVEMKE